MEIEALLRRLSERRPIFHSEADFQHALASELHLSEPSVEIRLERRIADMRVDMVTMSPTGNCAFELKYKTRVSQTDHAGESFWLRNHAAQDIGRYDFLKDVSRIEQVVLGNPGWSGCAVLLTNDPGYWRSGREGTVDSAFRLHDGRILDPKLEWDIRASVGTTRGRTLPLEIRGRYEIRWCPYARIGTEEFRYLAIKIGDLATSD
jgi:hypothetical protein